MFIAALYHPPKPVYSPSDILGYIESCDFPSAAITLAGDLNQLSDADIRTGLTQLVYQPTRGTNVLDRLFVSQPDNYSTVRVVGAVGKTDHKAIIVAYCELTVPLQRKETDIVMM